MAKLYFEYGGIRAFADTKNLRRATDLRELANEVDKMSELFWSSSLTGEDWTSVIGEPDKYIDDFFSHTYYLQIDEGKMCKRK